jgi:hypothetical protein
LNHFADGGSTVLIHSTPTTYSASEGFSEFLNNNGLSSGACASKEWGSQKKKVAAAITEFENSITLTRAKEAVIGSEIRAHIANLTAGKLDFLAKHSTDPSVSNPRPCPVCFTYNDCDIGAGCQDKPVRLSAKGGDYQGQNYEAKPVAMNTRYCQ